STGSRAAPGAAGPPRATPAAACSGRSRGARAPSDRPALAEPRQDELVRDPILRVPELRSGGAGGPEVVIRPRQLRVRLVACRRRLERAPALGGIDVGVGERGDDERR